MAKGSGKKNGSPGDSATGEAVTMSSSGVGANAAALEQRPRAIAPPSASSQAGALVSAAGSSAGGVGVVEWVGEIGSASVRAAQAVLPAGRTPLLLLGAGLLIAGVVELPVLVGAGLAYEALRRWQPIRDMGH